MSCKGGCLSQNNFSPTKPVFLFHRLFRSNSVQSRPSSSPWKSPLWPFVSAYAIAPGRCHDLQCCSPPLSFSSSLMCLSSSSRCCLWTLSFSLSFFKLRTLLAYETIYQGLKCYLSISFSRMNLFSAAASRFVKESLY